MSNSDFENDDEVDQDALSLKALAKGVLARDFRPRAASVRRLAEAVLDLKSEKKALKRSAKAGEPGAKARKSSKKDKKLARIPGQRGKG
ncbi:hypothetical protein [Aurantiacibacter gangjinensis]|uniref:Uncharacterized protein n=1 Tax=Aurantiacibacter gangjinensis TaxID=502682 RepID=A0A0G9MMA2_9SPHN|nr:hypothetical protein [Aurantiacibacter gangjinensis]APE27846.1 hypothetical protein BMF35_a1017 [Aurantiacibacter gangjinensis]KLE31822.1 hypothetical protein AAW01_10060 [Aurantiacibacter gangjinensis]